MRLLGVEDRIRGLAEGKLVPSWVKWSFQAVCFGVAAWYLSKVYLASPGELKVRLMSAGWGWIAAAVSAMIAMQVVSGWILSCGLAGRDLVLRFGAGFRIACISNFHSLIMPFQAGWGTRALMLNAAAGMRYRDYAKMSLGLWVTLILVSMWVASLTLLMPLSPLRAGAALGITAIALTVVRLTRIPNGLILFPLYALDALLSGLRYHFLFLACGTQAGYRECVFMGCFTILAPLFAPVPGGLGVLESAIVLGGRMGHLPAEASLAVALLNRLSSSVTYIALGLFCQIRGPVLADGKGSGSP